MEKPEKNTKSPGTYPFNWYDAAEMDAYIAHLESRLAQEIVARDHLLGIITTHGEVCPRILSKYGVGENEG